MDILPIILSILSVISNNKTVEFETFINDLNEKDNQIVFNENIGNYDELESYIKTYDKSVPDYNRTFFHYENLLDDLNNEYSNYKWVLKERHKTSYASRSIPINMQGCNFTKEEIMAAVKYSNIKSEYGGCGPIAIIGMLDYFARYFNFNKIINNCNDSNQRIELATKVFENSKVYSFKYNNTDFTWSFAKDLANTFNNVLNIKNENKIYAESNFNFFPGNDGLKNKIIESIDRGIASTLVTSFLSSDYPFGSHSTNIYGYDRYVGFNKENGESIEKDFLIGRMNRKYVDGLNCDDYEFCCDADILKGWCVGVVLYKQKSFENYKYDKNCFSSFINSTGMGQYFNYEKEDYIYDLLNNQKTRTNRLRCSYIENKYFVLSSNRKETNGLSFIEFEFNKDVSLLCFETSLWGINERISNTSFYLEAYDNELDRWYKFHEFDLNNFSFDKNNMKQYYVQIPFDTYKIRFINKSSILDSDRNKGRICLDNVLFESYEGI